MGTPWDHQATVRDIAQRRNLDCSLCAICTAVGMCSRCPRLQEMPSSNNSNGLVPPSKVHRFTRELRCSKWLSLGPLRIWIVSPDYALGLATEIDDFGRVHSNLYPFFICPVTPSTRIVIMVNNRNLALTRRLPLTGFA